MKPRQEKPHEIPAQFLDRMKVLLGDDYDAFLTSLQQPSVAGLRVNTLKIPATGLSSLSPWQLSPVPWCPAGFIIGNTQLNRTSPPPGKHPYHAAGLYYLQEPSAMAAAEALAPKPGEKVLDLAAAPGGKATHLAELMTNKGFLVANEIHPKRVWDLVENLERCGVTNSIVINENPLRLAEHFGEYFDRVLLDAPCSGEGMFRRAEAARQEWKPALVQSCSFRQASILESAARLLKPGGHLVYTTCTFSPDEDEGVIARFITLHPEFDLETIPRMPGFSPARPDWVALPPDHPLNRATRIWPHHAQGEGHFIAILVKRGSSIRSHAKSFKQTHNASKLSRNDKLAMDAFCRDALSTSFDDSHLAKIGSYIYLLPEEYPDLGDLHTIHIGWWLGSIQKDRFIPSHWLAMGISAPQARYSLNLSPEDPLLSAYFAGESIASQGENGWVLLCVDGFPVGWGKRVQNVLKNFYPRGLRRYS